MQQRCQDETDDSHLIDLLAGNACHWCFDGTLVAGDYKGNESAVCDTCGTPGATVW